MGYSQSPSTATAFYYLAIQTLKNGLPTNHRLSHKGQTMTANTPSPNNTAGHKAQLLAHLMTGAKITPLEALQRFNCLSCSQRLGDLRRDNSIPIQSRFITTPTGKKVKEYWLEPSYIQSVKGVTA